MEEWLRNVSDLFIMILNRLRDALHYTLAVLGYIIIGGLSVFDKKVSKLKKLEPISQLSPNVCRILGQNPGPFTLQGTNTYLIGNDKLKILIDCGNAGVKEYISNLKKALGDNQITMIICTHWHEDHVGGILDIFKNVTNGPIPVYKFKRTDASETPKVAYEYIEPGHAFTLPNLTLRCLATPGHTSDHMSLYMEEECTLFSGDCILGEGTSVFEDLYDYLHSLEKLLKLNITRIYPGHGPVIENGLEKIQEYIEHRKKREDQILNEIKILNVASCIQITRNIYRDLPWSVALGALNNVENHLKKLLKEGRIERVGFHCYRLTDSFNADRDKNT